MPLRLAGMLFFAAFAAANEAERISEILLGKSALILQQGAWQENMTVLDAGTSLVVIDTWSTPAAAARALEIIRRRFDKPVSHVIDTHHHFDHTFGNQVFAGARIVGHRLCAEDMRADYGTAAKRRRALDRCIASSPQRWHDFLSGVRRDLVSGFKLTPPAHLVDDREELRVGTLSLRLFHVPGLHTRSNLTVFVPELGLLFTRADFAGNTAPALEDGLDLSKLTGSLREILGAGESPDGGRPPLGDRPVKFLMVGHGRPVADPDLRSPLSYLQALDEAVRRTKASGKKPEAAESDPVFAAFAFLKNSAAVHRKNVAIAWRSEK